MPHVWTETRITQLTALWASGISASQIAREMGLTKNAVVGKAHRLNLPPRPSPITRRLEPRKPRIKRAPRTTLPALIEAPVMRAEPAPRPASPARRCCVWPMWGRERPGPDPLFCGAPVHDAGRVYCETHVARAYQRREETA